MLFQSRLGSRRAHARRFFYLVVFIWTALSLGATDRLLAQQPLPVSPDTAENPSSRLASALEPGPSPGCGSEQERERRRAKRNHNALAGSWCFRCFAQHARSQNPWRMSFAARDSVPQM